MHTLDRWGLAADACVVVRAGCRLTQGQGLGLSAERQANRRLSSSWGTLAVSTHSCCCSFSARKTRDGGLDGRVQGSAASEPRGALQ